MRHSATVVLGSLALAASASIAGALSLGTDPAPVQADAPASGGADIPGAPASAQPPAGSDAASQPVAPGAAEQGGVRFELNTRASFAFRADLDDDHGSVQVYRQDLRASVDTQPFERLRIGVDLSGEVADYSFRGVTNLAGADRSAFNTLYETTIAVRTVYSIDERWSIIGVGFATAGFQGDADFGDSIWGGGAVGAGYKVSDNFWFALGGGATTRLERSPVFIPLAQFTWKIDDTLTFATDRLGLRLTATLNDQWSFYFRGSFDYHQFRLDSDNSVLRKGIVSDESVPIGAGFQWRPIPALTVELEGGVVAYQQYKFFSSGGVDRQDVETNPAGYVSGLVSFRF